MAAATAALDGGWPLAIEERWDLKTVASVLPAFATSALSRFPANLPVGQSHMDQLRRYFPSSEKVRALLSFQDLYVGLSPYDQHAQPIPFGIFDTSMAEEYVSIVYFAAFCKMGRGGSSGQLRLKSQGRKSVSLEMDRPIER